VTQIILSLAIGVLLLGLMFYWLLQENASCKVDLSEARNTLGLLQSKFLPATLVSRILDYNDFVFVDAQRQPRILHLLEAERKAIATYWLCHTRQQVKALMTFHVKSARYSTKLAASLELRLALNYFAFLIACDAFQSLIWLRGPFYAARVARFTMMIATRFCAVSEKILSIAEAHHPNLPPAPGQQWPAGG
jgi:hypothetical protein